MNFLAFLKPKPTISDRDIKLGLRWFSFEGMASGGLFSITTSGFLAAFALALGANLVGIGRPLLSHALSKGYEGVTEWLEVFFDELSVAMFLAAATTIEELNQKRLIITGKTKDWLEQLGYDLPQLTK